MDNSRIKWLSIRLVNRFTCLAPPAQYVTRGCVTGNAQATSDLRPYLLRVIAGVEDVGARFRIVPTEVAERGQMPTPPLEVVRRQTSLPTTDRIFAAQRRE
uniref:Uncharacterized protein n=1 Tax=Oryza rufipogon TaxID=4529 RepID=A0A0E0PC14_ORYRU